MSTTMPIPVQPATDTIHGYAALGRGSPLTDYSFTPKPLGPMDVEVEVTHCGMCHTDLHLVNDDFGVSAYPLVPGHEVVGVISRVGRGVAESRLGERVGIGWLASADFTCEQCVAGLDNLCPSGQPTCVGREGGYADRIRVDSRHAFPIPAALPSEYAAPLFCGGIAVFAPLLRHVGAGTRLGVVGVGGLGHLALQFGQAMGAHVTAFSRSASKAEDAASFGADDFVDTSREGALAARASSCDFILCTVSDDVPWAEYVTALKPGGTLCIVGVPKHDVSFPAFPLIVGQKTVSASAVGSRTEIQAMLEFSARHRIFPQVELYPMAEVNAALERIARNEVRYRAVLVNE